MKFKMFLRGLGSGIVFTTIIMLIAFASFGKYKISDDEIKKKAEKLGMVEATEQKTEKEKETIEKEKETTEQVKETTEQEKETTEQEKETTEQAKETTEQEKKTTTEKTTKITSDSDEYIVTQITIKSGMDSMDVCRILENAGIIDDYKDFDNFLNSNNYSTCIRVDTFELNNNMSYEEIANVLTKR